MIYAVIMAGGTGTRFWPKSTRKTPKQFLNLFGERTMIQSTVDRLKGFIPEDRCMVVTNDRYVNLVKDQLPDIPESCIIGEPVARNTAPCVAAAAQILANKDPEAVMVVLPADHRIVDEENFRAILNTAVKTATQEDSIVTIGIRPNRPETGYGYIHFDKADKKTLDSIEVHRVKNFTEKPDRKKAVSFLESGDYLWNSGMFIWKAETILKAFEKHQPEIYSLLDHLRVENITQEHIDRFYRECPSISVDYGIMEHAENIFVVPGEFGWNDVGSWTAVHELADKDDSENSITSGQYLVQDSSGNLVHSESGKMVALVGVENLAIVETEKALLICDMKDSQDVKKIVEKLKSEKQLEEYL